MMLGDLTVAGRPPAKLVKALATIASGLHSGFDALPWIAPGKSKSSCVLASLTIREFLVRIGYRDASVVPCLATVRAFLDGRQEHSLGIGRVDPGDRAPPGHWPGHMVVSIPSAGWLIDSTLYPARRPQWQALPGMMAVPLQVPPLRVGEFDALAGLRAERDDGGEIELMWLHQPGNRAWRQGPDAIHAERRRDVAAALTNAFQQHWREVA